MPPTFSTALIGETEKTLNAILDRELSGTGLTEHRWIALTLAVREYGTLERHDLESRLVRSLKIGEIEARQRIDELAADGLLDADASPTDAGRTLHARIRTELTPIIGRLWGDLPPTDLEAAGRVLDAVLGRANAELAA